MNQLIIEKENLSYLNCTGLIPCSCLFQNASLMSLHGLNKSRSCLICRIGCKIVILDVWGKEYLLTCA